MKRDASILSLVVIAAGFLLAVSLPFLGAQQLTLEAVMSSAFPSNLVSSPKGDLIAWIFNEQGRRNVWIAKAPEYRAQKLTAFAEDDGQDITNLAFSADGLIAVFVRGGASNRAGEYPNPGSDPGGREQAVWAVKISGGEPRRIGEGSNPLPSPAENRLIYLLRNKIYLASLDEASKPQLLFQARGACRQPAWSPDGSKIAFSSERGDHSFIGLFDLLEKSLTWIVPSVDHDFNPVFSPDGKKLAFFRFPGSTATPSFGEGSSFWLMVADIETGKAREVWKCPDQSGGFVQEYPVSPLQWAFGDRLLFYSEHEGWMHIYSLSLERGFPVCLTPGDSEAEDCTLSPDRKTLIFSSNSQDIDRRHLWRVPVGGEIPDILTPGKGLEWSPAWISNGKDIAFLCSTAYEPASPAIFRLAEKEKNLIAPQLIPSIFSAKNLVEPLPVVFKAPDGLDIHGQLFLPFGATAGDKRPAVIFMHGGPMRQMLLGWHMRGYYHNAYAFNQCLAGRGYVVLAVNYRSGIGQGRAFREAPNCGPRGASEYQDIVAAAEYLQGRPEVNPKKIGLWGGSYGGYLTALGLARDSAIFAAGVDLHGVHDWSMRTERWGISDEEFKRTAFDSSPVADISFWSSPVLFIHGDDDRNVDFVQTVDLVQRLRKDGKGHVETLVFPDEVHSFLLHRRWLESFTSAADFFDRFLKGTGVAAPAGKPK